MEIGQGNLGDHRRVHIGGGVRGSIGINPGAKWRNRSRGLGVD